MAKKLPRIAKVAATGDTALLITWNDADTSSVDLTGWIASGGELLAPLRDPALFRSPRVADHGASVEWEKEGGDLAIDALHLALLAGEQRPFGRQEAAKWQSAMGFSNHEAATLLGLSLSTWNAYKAGGNIPPRVAMLCRAAQRDPILVQAHFRPRRPAGRPRKGSANAGMR